MDLMSEEIILVYVLYQYKGIDKIDKIVMYGYGAILLNLEYLMNENDK